MNGLSLSRKQRLWSQSIFKKLVSHDVRSNCLIVQSMALEHTPPIFHVASYGHEPKLPRSRAVVYCSTSSQGHGAAPCVICLFLSKVLLQGSGLATNASAASAGSVKVDLTPRFTFCRQMSLSRNSPEVGYSGPRDCNVRTMSRCKRAVPAQSMLLVHQYYCWLKTHHPDVSSELWSELEAFIAACHEGLLHKFALSGIGDWMVCMRSVNLMLLVLGVLPDEPTSFSISTRFASAFALSAFLSIGIQGEAGHRFISEFVSDYSEQLQSVVLHLHEVKGNTIEMSGATNFLFRFLNFFMTVAMANQTTSGYLQNNIILFFGIPWSAFGTARVNALLCCITDVRDHLLSLGDDATAENRSSSFLSGVFPILAQNFPIIAQGAASSYTVPNIATLMWLMLCNIAVRDFDRRISSDCFLLMMSVQPKHLRRFLPDVESLYMLTNLLSTLWPTACKVKLCIGSLPPCMWPSTLVALCEWMEQKQILSVERLGYLATNTSRHVIRAIQAECFHLQPSVCFGRHMVLRLLRRRIGRVPHGRGILVEHGQKILLSRFQRKLFTSPKPRQSRMLVSKQIHVNTEHANGMQYL